MKPHRTVFALLFLNLILLTSHAASGVNAKTVLSAAREASGGDAWERISALVADGVQENSGMRGPWRAVDDVKTGRMRRSTDFGVVSFLEVWNAPHHWRTDSSGGVHPLNSVFAGQASATDAWLARRGYLHPTGAGARLGKVETRRDADRSYQVIAATPTGGQPIELWFDPVSHLLARSVRVMPISTETTLFDDYRRIAGVMLPHLITTENSGDVTTTRVSTYKSLPSANDNDFEQPRTRDDSSVTGGKAIVPFELEGYVIVEAELNGRGPYAFILDTGGHDILTPEAAKALGLEPAGGGSAGGAGADVLPVQYARVERLKIGDVSLRDQNFFVIPLQYNTVERGALPPLAGILGLELFERFAVRFDYRARTLTFQPLGTYRYSGSGTALPITFSDDMPLVPAKLDGHSGDFALDTGNSGSLVVQHLWAKRVGLAEQMKHGVETRSFGSGGISRNWASRATNFEIAGVRLPPLVARYAEDAKGAFSSRTEAGNVGTDVLAGFVVDFDYRRGQVWFQPVPGYEPPAFNRSGMSAFKEKAAAFKIASVSDGGPAAEAGLRAEDEITAVNGNPATGISGTDLHELLRGAPGTRVRLACLRNGREFQAEIVLRELLTH
jgi:hypothetical protein